MRSKRFLVLWLILIFFMAADGHAQIDNLTNMSAEWVRSSNRNAATDAVDIVVYNPAGLVYMDPGLHADFSNQTLFRSPRHSFDFGSGKRSYEQDAPDLLLPNFYAAYVNPRWAVFGAVTIPAGGAVVDYPDGSITTDFLGTLYTRLGVADGFRDGAIEATSVYLTPIAGFAYRVHPQISVSAALRYIDAVNTVEAAVTLDNYENSGRSRRLKIDIKDTAAGWGAIFGLHVKPLANLDLGLRFESPVTLDFETDQKQDDIGITVDGEKNRRDLPAMIGLGIAYDMTDTLQAEVDFNWWFQSRANWDTDAAGNAYADHAGDCYSIGAALNWRPNPRLTLSTGFLFTKFLFDDIDAYYTNLGAFEVLYSDNWNLSGGFAYQIWKHVRLSAGLSWTLWDSENIRYVEGEPFGLDVAVETENSSLTLAAGISVFY